MNEQTDTQLLNAYVQSRSEAAFAELVRRHVDFVYSAGLRMVRDPHLAEDVTQSVFVALSKSAHHLLNRPVISGWLHRTAQNIAAQTVRTIERRRAREQEAAAMNQLHSAESGPAWEEIAPHLDAALGELSEPDRDALFLRYFERKSARQIAQTLGVSDEAAQKRVSRAVERLRECVVKRGVPVGVSGLAVVISANAVQAAPAGLAVAISTTAAVAGTGLAAATITKTIAMTTLQKVLVSVTLIAGVAAPLVIQHRTQVSLREENASFHEQLRQAIAENARLSNALTQATAPNPSNELSELLRLRGEVGSLRRQTNELGTLREANRRLREAQAKAPQSQPATSTAGPVDLPRESWAFAGYDNPESAVMSLAWSAASADWTNFMNSLTPEHQARERDRWLRNGRSEEQARDRIAKEFDQTKRIQILGKEALSENELILTLLIEHSNGGTETPKLKMQRIGNEWKAAGPVEEPH